MHEIEPQSETRLKEALRRMAAASGQSPAEMRADLLGKFRRHHARRRWMRRGGMLALATAMAVGAIWSTRSGSQRSGQQPIAETPSVQHEKTTTSEPAQSIASRPAPPREMPAIAPRARRTASTPTHAFLALPAYDPTVPMDELQVVRVQLPASALWTIGAPVPADAGERRLLADFVVGQDGTAYAVRLVQ
jgi:hypothetical protein